METDIKLIQLNLKDGKLLEAVNLIKSGKHKYDAKTVSGFIINMCHICQNNAKQVVPEVLADGLNYLVSLLDNFTEQQLNNYMRCLYFFVKFLMDKGMDYLILQLEHVIIPKFLPAHLSKHDRGVYEQITWYLLDKMRTNMSAGSNRCNYTKLCHLLLGIYCKIEDAKYLLSNCSYICLHILKKLLEDSENALLEFYCLALSKLDKLKKVEYIELIKCFSKVYAHFLMAPLEAANICLDETVRITEVLFKSEEYDYLRNLLKLPQWLMQAGGENDYTACLEGYRKTNGFDVKLQATCRCLVTTCNALVQHNLDFNWCNVPVENHLKFYKFLHVLSELWLKTNLTVCCNDCQVKHEVAEYLRTLNLILTLGKLHITSNDVTAEYQKNFLHYYQHYVHYVSYLKKNNCGKWKLYWRNAAGHIHAIINKKSGREKQAYLEKHARSIAALEEPGDRVLNQNCLLLALSSIGSIHLSKERFEMALALHSLNIAIHCDQTADIDSELMKWIAIKSKCRMSDSADSTIQELTMPSVLQRHWKELETYQPHLKLDEKLQVKLLCMELNLYKTRWTSKVSMMAAFREFYRLVEPARAAEVFVQIYGESNKSVHSEVTRLLNDIIGKLNPEEDLAQAVNLAYLYFLKNKHENKEIINCHSETICAQLDASKIVPEPGFGLDIGEQQGDLASYEFLNLNRYEKNTESLTKAADLIFRISESMNFLTQQLCHTFLRLLVSIGLYYVLDGHVSKSVSIWAVALKVTDLLGDSDTKKFQYQLQLVGYMMERSNANLEALTELARRGDDVVQKFADCSEEVVNYNICKALAFLIYDFDTAYSALCKVLEHKENFNGNHLIKARIDFAHHKFIMFPCRFNVSGHRKYNAVKMHNAYTSAATQSPNENLVDDLWRLIVYFETCEELTKMYCLMDLPREVKSYGKEAAILAQKMMLSLRTLSFLYYLAQADMQSRDLSGLQMKIKGSAEIMGLSKMNKSIRQKPIVPPPSEFDKIIEDLQCEFDEITLDCPSAHFNQRIASSPTFEVKRFTPPFYCEHPDQCSCSFCTTMEYQAFNLKHYYLNALYNTANDLHDVAKDYFMGCIKLFRFFKAKYDSKEMKGMPTFENVFLSAHYKVLLGLSDCLVLTKNFHEARKVNLKLLSYLTKVKAEHVFLYEAALLQAVKITIKCQAQPKPATKQFLEVDCQSVIGDGAKTPENKVLPCTIPAPNYSASPVPAPQKPWKGIKLEFSEDPEAKEKLTVPKNMPKNVNVTPMPSQAKLIDPFVTNMSETSAPTKTRNRAKSNLKVDVTPARPKTRSRAKSPSNLELPSSDGTTQATSLDPKVTPAQPKTRSRSPAESSSSSIAKLVPSVGKSKSSLNVEFAPPGQAHQPGEAATKSRTRSRAKSPSCRNTNEANVDKTPAPATRNRTQKSERTKPILSDVLEPNSRNSNGNGEPTDDIIDVSPSAHTPQTLKFDAKLESVLKCNRRKNAFGEDTENNFLTPQPVDFKTKTKLLTEKLKKSTRKAPTSVAKEELKEDKVASCIPVPKKPAAKRNLLNKLSSESTPQPEVKRTRRNAIKSPTQA